MKNQPPKYDQESRDCARYARNLADLLWRKACQTMTPAEQELLVECMHIYEMVARVVPEDVEQVNYTFDHVAESAEKAEDLLIGCPPAQSELDWGVLQPFLKDVDAKRISA